MKKTIAMLWLTSMMIFSTGCSDIDAKSKPASSVSKFDGTWKLSAQTKAGKDEEGNCGYGLGNGKFKISGTRITGNATDDSGYAYDLEGTIDETGKIKGALTYKGYDAATFQGSLSTTDLMGGGDFEDINGCPGSWTVEKRNGEQAKEAS